jgi:hypothetical protein
MYRISNFQSLNLKGMKHRISTILLFVILGIVNFQLVWGACNPPIIVCGKDTASLQQIVGHPAPDVWFSCVLPTSYSGPGPIIKFTSSTSFIVKAYGRFIIGDPCNIVVGAACDSFALSNSLTINTLHGSVGGEYYYFHVIPSVQTGNVIAEYLLTPNPCYPDTTELPCSDCIPSFDPQPDSSYIVSAWLKETGVSVNTTTYTNSSISITYTPSSHVSGPFQSKGQIIDGWQLVEDTFKVPHSSSQISIHLNSSTTTYFDDIRVFPYKGSMKSYVFDPLTLRLVAELDERNYATMYEYDEEGKLMRVKKETERGIMTIQENKSNTSK